MLNTFPRYYGGSALDMGKRLVGAIHCGHMSANIGLAADLIHN